MEGYGLFQFPQTDSHLDITAMQIHFLDEMEQGITSAHRGPAVLKAQANLHTECGHRGEIVISSIIIKPVTEPGEKRRT